MRKTIGIVAFIAAWLAGNLVCVHAQNADFHVVPLPKEVKATQAGNFELDKQTLIAYPSGDKELKRYAQLLADYIHEATGLKMTLTNMAVQRKCIKLSRSLKHKNAEAYHIRVNSEIVWLDGASAAGLFYAIQTFRKALPVGPTQSVVIPSTEVNDAPRFAYRGAHLDVSRHFVTPDSVCRFIDMLALHNINRLHWHITDDQGWRIEIKKYPRLTEIGSKRPETVIGHNTGRYDGIPHSGFYTQKDIRRIVDYAAGRHITIIPEIDLPGHMQAALAAYPELGCTGGPYEVWKMWGVSDHVLCAGNERTFTFIENVLAEVIKLFPSQYIHIGGDECPKTQWEKCPKCQQRIRDNHLEADGKHAAEERLQSYVIGRAEAFLKKHGRRIIGWDEILEGGLAPDATVMSWRGEGGGIEAARQGHDVIMTPNTYCYFDYYQSDQKDLEPEAIGGYVPIERVYSYEPASPQLTPEEQRHILGVQANCWTEYMKTFRQVEYMELPRMAALSEVQWCAPEQKDFDAFIRRLQRLVGVYRLEGYNYAKVIYRVKKETKVDTAAHAIMVSLSTCDGAPVYYTLDGTAPTPQSARYERPIPIRQDAQLRAVAIRPGETTPEVAQTFHFNKATASPVSLETAPPRNYTFGGAQTLTDGVRATTTNYRNGQWLGFAGSDVVATVDLGKEQSVSRAELSYIVEKGDWIFAPRRIEVYGSTDGNHFSLLTAKDYPALTENDPNGLQSEQLSFPAASARYIKLRLVPEMKMPQWHPGAGSPAFIFLDEIGIF